MASSNPEGTQYVRVALAEIDTEDRQFNGRLNINDATVQKYVDAVDFLPPITIWRNPDFKKDQPLAPVSNMPYKALDGIHRHKAFKIRSGDPKDGQQYLTIPAEILTCSRDEAQSIGLTANLKTGMPYSLEERDLAVIGWLDLHPGISHREAAPSLSLNHLTIGRIVKVEEIQKKVGGWIDQLVRKNPGLNVKKSMPRQLLYEVADVPDKYRRQVVENVYAYGWTRSEIRTAAKVLRSKDSTEAQIADALSHDDGSKPLSLDEMLRLSERLAEASDDLFLEANATQIDAAQKIVNSIRVTAEQVQGMIDNRKEALHAEAIEAAKTRLAFYSEELAKDGVDDEARKKMSEQAKAEEARLAALEAGELPF